MSVYSIGLDFGSLSVRGLLVDVATGREIQTAEYVYPHGIFEKCLPDGTFFPDEFALQDPHDYLDGIKFCCKTLLKTSGINPANVIGIGMDATASTILPVDSDGTALCDYAQFHSEPQAWLKLWKHHGATDQAKRLTDAARKSMPDWFQKRGQTVSSEWFLPKAIELAEKAPNVYEKADSIIEVVDWLACLITNTKHRSEAIATCNCCYNRSDGYPANELLVEASPMADKMIQKKFREKLVPLGEKTGVLSEYGAALLGLIEGTPVASPIVDSHAGVCAAGACQPGDLVYVCGTSAVELLLTQQDVAIPGVHINAPDVSVPGLTTLGTGQTCVGDLFSWFISNCVPADYQDEAKRRNMDIFSYLNEKASLLGVGGSGLIALDWWNGVRTPLFRFDLSGALLGLNVHTRPEHIYLALLEAHAFNVRKCMDYLTQNGNPIKRVFATGGIPAKNPLLMQILADVLDIEIGVCQGRLLAALGSAIMGASAAGMDFGKACSQMKSDVIKVYQPNQENKAMYETLYADYCDLSERFGTDSKLQKLLCMGNHEK